MIEISQTKWASSCHSEGVTRLRNPVGNQEMCGWREKIEPRFLSRLGSLGMTKAETPAEQLLCYYEVLHDHSH
ncbi:hypothetical protein Pr1d_12280 [Bythopirellula goksoeyrii]|uniref:Uncharacterized protein n=1 Tax=Bythopirellula goksoeyrii TaxID=1400387 RepID=A0A5B9Q4R2_9BACT|nr:hypothetical protein Pr1d_12280 [Bythopirellula goksoeyrii]